MTITAIDPRQAKTRLHELVVIDVRTPGEYAGGHVPGALNIPLDQIDRALPDIRDAAERGEVLVVCASGARSEKACVRLASEGIRTATLSGGTGAWAAHGHELDRASACDVKSAWSMDRQVRLTAGSLVLLGLALGEFVHPAFRLLSAGVAGGLVFSAVTNTCGMAAMLGKLPHNRPRTADLDATLARLRNS
ncbi:rhodanese-like domain-containing protein [Streptomyces naganishii]|uniref:Transporter n=1 Tax=Streptomyces naganishii JCM 4654 TaxID=1306179 RepID=A0A918Y0P8_9ACTN|nr:rhodanese-like domain-containing protein [Streptomyces naganishii]GHD86906.1 transporter [Streptomyces naganishii JCM 4654]